MGRMYTLKERLLGLVCVITLIAIVVGSGVFAAVRFIGNRPVAGNSIAADTEIEGRLNGLGTEDTEVTAESDLTLNMSREVARNLYGGISPYLSLSETVMMGDTRARLTGFTDAVSIPFYADQAWIDAQLGSDMPKDVFWDLLEDKVKEWEAEFAKLEGNELESTVRDKISEEIMRSPVYGDMVAQALLQYPQIATANPWLVDFKAKVDETYSRTEDGGKLVGLDAWVHYENAEAQADHDLTKIVINTEDSSETGAYEYFYDAARIAELVNRYFMFEGRKEKPKSIKNWHMPKCADESTVRTCEDEEQENRPAFIFVPKSKMLKSDMRFGFNLADRRIELFKVKEPTPKTPKSETPDTPKPSKPDPDPGDGKVKLTVKYLFTDGKQAATPFVGYYQKGAYYDVPSKKVSGYTPDRPSVKGGPIQKDMVEVVTYYKEGQELHNATILYVLRGSGKTAAPSFSKKMAPGETHTQNSPVVQGYKPDKPSVELKMQHQDITVTVYYDKTGPGPDPKEYTVTVTYVIADGGVAAPSPKSERHKAGEAYSIPSDKVDGYVPDRSSVDGVMPEHDVAVTVTYTKKKVETPTYTVTVTYVIADGGVAAPSPKSERHKAGEAYSIPSDKVDGYVPDRSSVDGVMPEHDVAVTVTYRRKDGNSTKDPEDGTGKRPGPEDNPGGGGNRPDDKDEENNKPDPSDKENTGGTGGGGGNENDDPTKPPTKPNEGGDAPVEGGGNEGDADNNDIIEEDFDPVVNEASSPTPEPEPAPMTTEDEKPREVEESDDGGGFQDFTW